MFNFDKEIEEYEEKSGKIKCLLCRDTGKYYLYNKNICYTCYGCDAAHKNKKDEPKRTKRSKG